LKAQELFDRISAELAKMEHAVQENAEFVAVLATAERPSVRSAVIGGIALNLQGFLYRG